MGVANPASTLRRRNAVGLVTSTACHVLLFGLGATFMTRSQGGTSATESIAVDLVAARPDPVRDVAPSPPDQQPAPTMTESPPVMPKRPVARTPPGPKARPQVAAPDIAVGPSTELANPDDVALPATVEPAPRKDDDLPRPTSPSAALPAPAPSGPGPITVLAAPRYRSNPRPEYPLASRRRHEEGEVRVAVTVSPEGRPVQVSLAHGSGHPLLDQAAIAAVRTWTFEPARASGVAVTSEVVVPVRYALSQE